MRGQMVTDEMAEIEREITTVVTAMIQAASRLAQTLIRLRAEQLRRAAALGEARARETRARARAAQQADAVVWRAVHRGQWWRQAGAEDIALVWRAASTWAEVDPRAEEARRIVTERLAERDVHIDVHDDARPDDAVWLAEALDRAAVDKVATDVTQTEAASTRDAREDRRAQMADHVRAAWAPQRAERVLGDEAWPVLAQLLERLETEGRDVRQTLGAVPAFIDRARSPAAYAFRVIDDPRQVSSEAQERIRVRARAARLDERDRGVDTPVAGEGGTQRGASPEAEAAHVAAQGYPSTTREAVAGAKGPATAGESSSVPAAVRPQPAPQQHRPRDPHVR